ncbi:MAG TPA: NlpC/P60 family protein [Lachnospiraceae bacterium]|nr:NlpC/P60 family protein [Lachnospiraceae bacterium]
MKIKGCKKIGIGISIGIGVSVAVIGMGSISYADFSTKIQYTAGAETILSSLDHLSKEEIQQLMADSTRGKEIKNDFALEETEEPESSLWGFTNLGVANVSENLNIRENPDTTSKILGKLPKDAGCEIISMENGWSLIKSGKVEGYVSLDYLFVGDTAIEKAKEVATLRATVTAQNLKIRKEASTNSGVRGLVANGTSLEVVEEVDDWVKVIFEEKESYVSKDYVKVGEQLKTALTIMEEKYGVGVTDAGINLAEYAIQFVGNPYVYGGVSLTNGADCSGFTLTIFKKYGFSLSHSARAQSGYGTSVSLTELKPGDLVFYSDNSGINHVVIYIGNGQVVHASSPKNGIMISNINYRTPTCARRLF